MIGILKNAHQFIKPSKKEFFLSIILSIMEVLCVSYYPYLLRYIIDNYQKVNKQNIIWIISSFIFSIFLILITLYFNKIVKNKYEYKIKSNLRRKIFTSIIEMPYENFSENRIENFTSLIINDLNDFYTFCCENLIYNVNSIIMLITYTICLYFFSWEMCLLIMGSLIFVFAVPFISGKKFEILNKNFISSRANYLSHIDEYMNAHCIYSKDEINRFKTLHDKHLQDAQGKKLKLANYRSLTQIISGSSLYIQLIICFSIGLILAVNNKISFGIFTSSLIYVEYVASYSTNIVDELLEIKSVKEYLTRIQQVLNQRNRFIELDSDKNRIFQKVSNKIILNGVSYIKDNKIILQKISMTIEKSKKYLITGENGSGKTTLLKILAGLLTPTTGQIIYPINFVYDNNTITYIPQDRFLFEGTVLENIILFFQPTKQDINMINSLCEMLNLTLSLNNQVNKNGQNLSGGEKAKICLIRGLLNKSKIYIIDEPLNDVDDTSRNEILNVLSQLNATLIVVSHGIEKKIFDEIITIKPLVSDKKLIF